MVREREYVDSELAKRLREWLINERFSTTEIYCSQVGSRVYFRLQGVEYVAIFESKDSRRLFSFHVENPKDSLVQRLQEGLMSGKRTDKSRIDNVFETNKTLLQPKYRGHIEDYQEMFEREGVRESFVYLESGGEMKQTPSAVSVVSIKEVPLGKKKHLSGNFIPWIFYYNMLPVILLTQEHPKQ